MDLEMSFRALGGGIVRCGHVGLDQEEEGGAVDEWWGEDLPGRQEVVLVRGDVAT